MTLRQMSQPRWLLSSLLIAGAALFAVGVAAERNAANNHPETGTETAHAEQPATETTEHDEQASDAEASTAEQPPAAEAARHPESSTETVLGLNLESTGLVIVAAIASLALALLTWRLNLRPLLLAAVAFAAVFTAFDIAELVHQIKESRTGIAALAAVIALLHVAAALVAAQRTTSAST